jgi:tRNA-splicing ligase RtcB (3'-phosphate/5'-hydroxy nucleic acid ligase)
MKVNYKIWGNDIEPKVFEQMDQACSLPISKAGALMSDAHVGYGLPVGGVLATYNSVIPYAVGVDIGCRVKISILDLPTEQLSKNKSLFIKSINNNTAFGRGATFSKPKKHEVLDKDWCITPQIGKLKDIAYKQLGSSGSGNHFVEFGEFNLIKEFKGLPPKVYTAFVSHSGSRGPGARIAEYYTKIAKNKCPKLQGKLADLAWLELNTSEGQEYWAAMELMGAFASANHDLIHRDVLSGVGGKVLLSVENHHNFAWRETHLGENLIVHRKGATPAGKDVLGYIPGTMIDYGYLVRGLGNQLSLNSASHGAGRKLSRTKARKSTTKKELEELLRERNVKLLSGGLDETPMAYKAIDTVMKAQEDLVEIVGKFKPRIVKMAPDGERAED